MRSTSANTSFFGSVYDSVRRALGGVYPRARTVCRSNPRNRLSACDNHPARQAGRLSTAPQQAADALVDAAEKFDVWRR